MMHSALLQHSCSRSLPLSLTSASPCRPITYFHTPVSFPTCALKSPKSIVDLLVLTLRWVSLICFTNSGNSTLEFGPYACAKHWEWSDNFNLNMHILPPRTAVPNQGSEMRILSVNLYVHGCTLVILKMKIVRNQAVLWFLRFFRTMGANITLF